MRVHVQRRRAWRADHLIGEAEQSFLRATENEPDQRDLSERIVDA